MRWQSHSLLQGISQPRGQAWVSHIASRFFTIWATREVPYPFICFYLHAFRECVAQRRRPAILAGTAWSLLQGLELNILRTVPTVSKLFISDRDALLLKNIFLSIYFPQLLLLQEKSKPWAWFYRYICNLNLKVTQWNKYHDSHFIDEETEA